MDKITDRQAKEAYETAEQYCKEHPDCTGCVLSIQNSSDPDDNDCLLDRIG